MIASDLVELIFTFSLVVVCISYMLMGCAGHKKKAGDEESQLPGDEGTGEMGPSKIEQGRASSQAAESIAGYQSQTSEILAGPGEDASPSRAGSVLSQASGSSHASRAHSSTASHVGSTMSSNVGSSHAGSTLDSAMGSRAVGASSVLSMLSRSGPHSNIQSTLSSHAPGGSNAVASTLANSHLQSSRMASNLDSNAAARSQHSNFGPQSVLSALSNMGRGGGPTSRYSQLQSSNVGSSAQTSSVTSRTSTKSRRGGQSSMTGGQSSAAGSQLSRAISSAVQISGSSPVSSAKSSAASSPASSARSAVTPPSEGSRRSSK